MLFGVVDYAFFYALGYAFSSERIMPFMLAVKLRPRLAALAEMWIMLELMLAKTCHGQVALAVGVSAISLP